MHRFAVGETHEVFVRFFDEDGVATDPTDVDLTVTAPDGSSSTPAVTNDTAAVGRFTVDHLFDQAGVWTFEWVGTGAVSAEVTDYVLAGPHAHVGPCEPWVDAEQMFSCAPTVAEDDRNWSMAELAVESASELLYWRTGSCYHGVCEATVRPCRRSQAWTASTVWLDTWQESWGWCSCQSPSSRRCGCPSMDEITLGGEPVVAVTEVLVDGLAVTEYRVDDRRWLVRTDGEGWPCCQDLSLEATEADTFQVTYLYGQDPPAAGRTAAARLARELYAACDGGTCRLPKRLETLTRQGVQMGFLDPFEFFEQAQTGLYEVDLFLSMHDWKRTRGPAVVAGPHVDRRVRRVGV